MPFPPRRTKTVAIITTCGAIWLAALAPASATPLPSPLAIELSSPVQRAAPGESLTFSGVFRNLTADTLYLDGWGLSLDRNVSGYPVSFSFSSELLTWPKALAFRPFEVTPMIPLFTATIAPDFARSVRRLGSFAMAVYPLGTPIYNPDGTLTHDNAYANFAIEIIGDPSVPEPIPEPSTIVLTTIGGLFMLYRRRGLVKGRAPQ